MTARNRGVIKLATLVSLFINPHQNLFQAGGFVTDGTKGESRERKKVETKGAR